MNFYIDILSFILSLILFYIFSKFYIKYKKRVEQGEINLKKDIEIRDYYVKKYTREVIINEIEKEEIKYQLQTHKVKYELYSSSKYLKKLNFLYTLIIHKNFWINEPFHSKFFELLLIFDNNEFMIIDSNSKVITMNIRDENNNIQISKAYQVYNTQDILDFVIRDCIEDIITFNKLDAQNLVIAIFILVLEQSVYNLSSKITQKIIQDLLEDYESSNIIKDIVKLIKEKDEQIIFIIESFYEAFNSTPTLAYNDCENINLLSLPKKLPKKSLIKI